MHDGYLVVDVPVPERREIIQEKEKEKEKTNKRAKTTFGYQVDGFVVADDDDDDDDENEGDDDDGHDEQDDDNNDDIDPNSKSKSNSKQDENDDDDDEKDSVDNPNEEEDDGPKILGNVKLRYVRCSSCSYWRHPDSYSAKQSGAQKPRCLNCTTFGNQQSAFASLTKDQIKKVFGTDPEESEAEEDNRPDTLRSSSELRDAPDRADYYASDQAVERAFIEETNKALSNRGIRAARRAAQHNADRKLRFLQRRFRKGD